MAYDDFENDHQAAAWESEEERRRQDEHELAIDQHLRESEER